MAVAKQIFKVIAALNTARRSEIHGHAHGGVIEVYWTQGEGRDEDEFAYGYFGDSSTIHVTLVIDGESVKTSFEGDRAKALRHCGRCVSIETDADKAS